MSNSATTLEQHLRKTKAQLIDEIDTLEQRAAATPEGGSELKRRIASINDLPIAETDRKFHWPLCRRPDEHPGLTKLGH